MARIVTYAHRYKRPPRKRRAVALEIAGKPVIVTTKSRRASIFGDAPDLAPDEHRQRGDAADALWRELVCRAAGDE